MCANHLPRGVQLGFLLSACLGITLASGCAPRAQVRLLQPAAPPAQQDIRLSGEWADVWTDGTRRECLLDFPLPQSKDGPRDFRLFLSLAATDGVQSLDPDDAQAARGFLIQAVGNRKGKAVFTGGTVRLRPIPFDRRHQKLELDLTCEDGSRVVGTAKVREDELEVRSFKRRFVADVAAMESRAATGAEHVVDEQAASISADEAHLPTDGESAGNAPLVGNSTGAVNADD
jgi:hypothetical protein